MLLPLARHPAQRELASTEVPSAWLSSEDAAAYIGMSEAWLRQERSKNARRAGDAPPFLRIGRTIRYRVTDLDAWLERHEVGGCPAEPAREATDDTETEPSRQRRRRRRSRQRTR